MSRLTDNDVAEVAKMQKHIDNLELYFQVLHLALKGKQTSEYVEDEGTPQSWAFGDVWEFLKFVRKDFAFVFDAFNKRKAAYYE